MAIAAHDETTGSAARTVDGRTLSDRPAVYILSDVRLLRDGLGACLVAEGSLRVLGAGDLQTCPERIGDLEPSALLLDIGNAGGLPYARRFRQGAARTKVVAIAVAEVEADVVACAEAGVAGFVSRDGSIDDVVAAVRAAVRDEMLVSPRMAATLFGRLAKPAGPTPEDIAHQHVLTAREYEIARCVEDGLSNKEIARQLRICDSTVKNHMHHLLGKLNLRRRGEIARHLSGRRPASVAD